MHKVLLGAVSCGGESVGLRNFASLAPHSSYVEYASFAVLAPACFSLPHLLPVHILRNQTRNGVLYFLYEE
jgi:hypothetical protein